MLIPWKIAIIPIAFQERMANKNLNKAKEAKKDEFYTQLEDINNELRHYREHFRGKTVLCNCDDPRVSNFFKYFAYNFEFLGLKKLIAICYKSQDVNLFSEGASEQAVYLIYEGDKNGNHIPDDEEIEVLPLKGDGDFRSPECIEFLKEADIVVTNPPFSLFREYIAQLIKYDKKFLIIGNVNAVTCKELDERGRKGVYRSGESRSGTVGNEELCDVDAEVSSYQGGGPDPRPLRQLPRLCPAKTIRYLTIQE